MVYSAVRELMEVWLCVWFPIDLGLDAMLSDTLLFFRQISVIISPGFAYPV